MNVVFGAASLKELVALVPNDAADVGVEIVFPFGLNEGASAFGAPDQMVIEGGVGGWHGVMGSVNSFRPFGAVKI